MSAKLGIFFGILLLQLKKDGKREHEKRKTCYLCVIKHHHVYAGI